jgi:HD-GYP domain-containing protein (c-di-GMP phosphodiesterase class II)
MTSDRPYRAARTRDEAVAELRRCADRQFDRTVVVLLCAVLADEDAQATAFAAES